MHSTYYRTILDNEHETSGEKRQWKYQADLSLTVMKTKNLVIKVLYLLQDETWKRTGTWQRTDTWQRTWDASPKEKAGSIKIWTSTSTTMRVKSSNYQGTILIIGRDLTTDGTWQRTGTDSRRHLTTNMRRITTTTTPRMCQGHHVQPWESKGSSPAPSTNLPIHSLVLLNEEFGCLNRV